MDLNKTIKIKFMTEKVVGHGEDAPPLLVMTKQECAIGVFDGMGGAGASTCQSDFGDNQTKAYVASRIIKNEIESYLKNHQTEWNVSAKVIKDIIVKRLEAEHEKYPSSNKSILRSKLIRDYPTTMALITIQEKKSKWKIDSYWAGDSRCYLWTKDGFYQISKDDLIGNCDPMENLHNDAPMSNCICADRDFTINHLEIVVPKNPVIIMCATDGCFGYYPTPMHLEQLLRSKLKESKNIDEWKEKIIEDIQQVTGDDSSLALAGFGFNSFEKICRYFMISPDCVNSFGFSKVKTFIKRIGKKFKQIKNLKDIRKDGKRNAINNQLLSEPITWDDYKKVYMKYINEKDHADA